MTVQKVFRSNDGSEVNSYLNEEGKMVIRIRNWENKESNQVELSFDEWMELKIELENMELELAIPKPSNEGQYSII